MKTKAFVNFKPLPETWRQTASSAKDSELVTRGLLMSFLSGQTLRPATNPLEKRVGRFAHTLAVSAPSQETADLFQQSKS